MPHMQKPREALADARKSIRKKSKTNSVVIVDKQTVAVLSQRHDFVLLYHFFGFFVFLIRNFISFCSPFYYCN